MNGTSCAIYLIEMSKVPEFQIICIWSLKVSPIVSTYTVHIYSVMMFSFTKFVLILFNANIRPYSKTNILRPRVYEHDYVRIIKQSYV